MKSAPQATTPAKQPLGGARLRHRCAQASVQLKAAFAASQKAYGSRRLSTAMAEQGLSMGRHRIRTLMRLNGLRPTWRLKFVHTTDSQHVLDLHSRKVVGWATSPAVPAGLVCAALQMAIVQRNPAPGLIVHSDRGTQYASAEHQGLLSKHGLVGSMGRKGNCWDNAVMERVWHQDYANHLEATSDIADYIVGFYNSIRLHSNLGNMSPNAFEREPTSKKPSVLSEII